MSAASFNYQTLAVSASSEWTIFMFFIYYFNEWLISASTRKAIQMKKQHTNASDTALPHAIVSQLLSLHRANDLNELWKAMIKLFETAIPHTFLLAALPFEDDLSIALRTTIPIVDRDDFWKKLFSSEPPLFRVIQENPGIQVADMDDYVTTEELFSSKLYHHIMLEYQWRYSIGMIFWEADAMTAHVSLCRHESSGRFTKEDQQLMLAMHPHIEAAIRRVTLFEKERFLNKLLCATLETRDDGLVLLDSQGQIHFHNKSALIACSIWNKGDAAAAISVDASEQLVLPEEIRQAVTELITTFLREYRHSQQIPIKLEREIQHPLGHQICARVSLIVPQQRPVSAHVRIEFARMTNPISGIEANPIYRLSNSEYKIAQLVARGLTNSEVAAAIGISVNTVRAHLREIFSKLGVTSRSKLAALMKSWQ